MIFVTVGTQLPFPRLMNAMNDLAPGLSEPVIAQCGPISGDWPNLDLRPSLPPAQFAQTFRTARLIVGHAGIGTLLSAQQHQKPLIVLPRQHALGEHRNDHQLATARQIEAHTGVYVAWETADIARFLTATDLEPAQAGSSPAFSTLIETLTGFIDG